MACEADHVDYPNGRVVLKMSFRKFQRYLSTRLFPILGHCSPRAQPDPADALCGRFDHLAAA
jgi:hypothetical protein